MKANLGTADRIIRLLLAAALLAMYFLHVVEGTTAIILLIVGALLAVTSFMSFCPIYYALHLRTNKKQ